MKRIKTLLATLLCALLLASCAKTRDPAQPPIETAPQAEAVVQTDPPPTAENAALTRVPFEGIMGLDGYYTENEGIWCERRYYTAAPDGGEPIQIARCFGFGMDDYVVDLDGDGVTELVCNCVYGGDGHSNVSVFRRNDGVIEQGRIDTERVDMTGWVDWGANSTGSCFDPEDGVFLFSYDTEAGPVERRFYDLSPFKFEEFAVLDADAWVAFATLSLLPTADEGGAVRDALPYAPECESVPKSAVGDVLCDELLPDGTHIVLFRPADDNNDGFTKYWALERGDTLQIFCAEDSVYSGGYGVEPYENVLGHDGFCIYGPRGAAYNFVDFYYFDDSGAPQCLDSAANWVIRADLNNDGTNELLWLYHLDAYYDYMLNGKLCRADLRALVGERGGWEWEGVDLSAETGLDSSVRGRRVLPITLREADGGAGARRALLYFNGDAVELVGADSAAGGS